MIGGGELGKSCCMEIVASKKGLLASLECPGEKLEDLIGGGVQRSFTSPIKWSVRA